MHGTCQGPSAQPSSGTQCHYPSIINITHYADIIGVGFWQLAPLYPHGSALQEYVRSPNIYPVFPVEANVLSQSTCVGRWTIIVLIGTEYSTGTGMGGWNMLRWKASMVHALAHLRHVQIHLFLLRTPWSNSETDDDLSTETLKAMTSGYVGDHISRRTGNQRRSKSAACQADICSVWWVIVLSGTGTWWADWLVNYRACGEYCWDLLSPPYRILRD